MGGVHRSYPHRPPGPRDLLLRWKSPPPLVRAFDEVCFGPQLVRVTGAIDQTSSYLQGVAVQALIDLGGQPERSLA